MIFINFLRNLHLFVFEFCIIFKKDILFDIQFLHGIPMIFAILLNQLNLLLFDFFINFLKSIIFKLKIRQLVVRLDLLRSLQDFIQNLALYCLPIMLYLLWMVEYRAHKYNFLSMNFLASNLALYMTILLHNPREKIQWQASFSSLAMNKLSLPRRIL
jgi:hypothetical protein